MGFRLLFLFFILGFIFGCSSSTSLMKSNHDSETLEIRGRNLHSENFFNLIKTAQRSYTKFVSRGPSTENKGLSLRRTYFSSLYFQFLLLGQVTQTNKENQQFCPQFHYDFNLMKNKFHHIEMIQLNPYSKSTYQKLQKTTREELKELCENGFSNDYFKFENLMTFFSKEKTFHQNPSSLYQLMKISLYRNHFYLMNFMLDHNKNDAEVALINDRKDFIILSQTQWFSDFAYSFFHHLQKNKLSFSSGQNELLKHR